MLRESPSPKLRSVYGANPACVLTLSHTSWRRTRSVHVLAASTEEGNHWKHSPWVTCYQATVRLLPLRRAEVILEGPACSEPTNPRTTAAAGLGITLESYMLYMPWFSPTPSQIVLTVSMYQVGKSPNPDSKEVEPLGFSSWATGI